MKKILILYIILYLYSGCSSVANNAIEKEEQSACSKKANPKSLLSIEQQYRCNHYQ